MLKNKHFKRWLPLSDAKHTDSSNITHLNGDFDYPGALVLRDITPFGQINGKRGHKQILFPQEADAIIESRTPQPKPPYAQTLLKQAHEFKKRLGSSPGMTQTSLARELGISRVRVTQIINLLRLAPEIQKYILVLPPSSTRGPITEYSLRHLAAIRDHRLQILEFKRRLITHNNVPSYSTVPFSSIQPS